MNRQRRQPVHWKTLSSAEAYVASKTPLSTQECCDIVQKILEDLAPQAHGKNIDLGFERSGCDTVIASDPAALREIAVNVIDNAIRYTPADGIVTVRIESTTGHIALAVEDNGPGVPVDQREKIFQRFYRMSATVSTGSGLGLAIVKELCSQCGAKIQLNTPAGGGSGLSVVVDFFDA